MRIKICGITNLDDALSAVEAGADMLGFNFYPKSPRCIKPEDCAVIIRLLRARGAHPTTVGVFVNAGTEEVRDRLDFCGLDLAQLHGDEPPEMLAEFGERAYKALRPATPADLEQALLRFPEKGTAPAVLVDAHSPDKYGGTGHKADWELARLVARSRPLLLAGGLDAENVAEAIRQVRPWGVDVASGVESAPGRKDPRKIAEFIQAARRAVRNIPMTIELAHLEDAAEILSLQKFAYRSEAELNQDFCIPPLTQTLPEIQAEFSCQLFLKAEVEGCILGSVRAYTTQDGVCHIGRLIVHPDWQNLGIGSRLLRVVERCFKEAKCYELFTSERSTRNIYLYEKLGYRLFKQEKLNERVNLVYLVKYLEKWEG